MLQMKNIKDKYKRKKFTNKIIQFGEGNFLRCFFDWQIDLINEKSAFDAGITVVRAIDTDFPPSLNTQDGLYTTVIRGIDENGERVKEYRVIKSVNREIGVYKEYDRFLELAREESYRYIVSNTTEAGITFDPSDTFDQRPPGTFPAKLTRFLYERYKKSGGDKNKGFIILPCELIDYNGRVLKELVLKYSALWDLEVYFERWIEEANTFCSTLVDRIVTGYPADEIESIKEELGYEDTFLTAGEYFYLLVIQGPKWLEKELFLDKADLNVKIVEDIKPYITRKVGLLNGAHTSMVPVGYLYGMDFVKECVENPEVGAFLKKALFEEIIPVLPMDKTELDDFARAVLDRFKNPYIKHELLSISLNSMTKFRTRVLPQILGYLKKYNRLPDCLVFSLAALILFYKGEREMEKEMEKEGEKNGETKKVKFELKDNSDILALYGKLWRDYEAGTITLSDVAAGILGYEKNWRCCLLQVPGLKEKVTEYLAQIEKKGMRQALVDLLA